MCHFAYYFLPDLFIIKTLLSHVELFAYNFLHKYRNRICVTLQLIHFNVFVCLLWHFLYYLLRSLCVFLCARHIVHNDETPRMEQNLWKRFNIYCWIYVYTKDVLFLAYLTRKLTKTSFVHSVTMTLNSNKW